jgi:hypothetical protein
MTPTMPAVAGVYNPYAGQVPASQPYYQAPPPPAGMPQFRPPQQQYYQQPAPQQQQSADDDGDGGWDDDPAPRQRGRGRSRNRDDGGDRDRGNRRGRSRGDDTGDGDDEPRYVKDNGELDFGQLPRSVQDYFGRLRDENASHRVRARDADDRYKAIVRVAAEALDIDESEISAENLADILGVAADETRANHIERHAARVAYARGADVDALFDSSSFAKALDALDPFADDFQDQVSQLVADTLDANPRFVVAPAEPAGQPEPQETPAAEPAGQGQAPAPVPARSGAQIPGGSGGTTLITKADLDHMSEDEITTALSEGRLSHLL